MDIREYVTSSGESPFRELLDGLTSDSKRRVVVAVYHRIGLGNFSNVKGAREDVFECRIDFGPGFRVYFGKDGERIVILLGGGTKRRQQPDIETAIARWNDYKERKSREKKKSPGT